MNKKEFLITLKKELKGLPNRRNKGTRKRSIVSQDYNITRIFRFGKESKS